MLSGNESRETKEEKIVVVIKDCYYFYGIYADEFKDKNYIEALNIKIAAAKQLAKKLLENDYLTCDTHRLNDVLSAIKFNIRLLKEAK